ncbi:hypothetical protein AQUCO_05800007v1 [Aquilegia coerulea]|uniref:HTH La-type RNA-binding domain-containing protein n=1 Tax=Aquilegia coerulea TaxID=218851 RepID=A0A2G5CE76_AQUCA|nr:hypothetical protein AQUCO_05800007v1 [Aquilegia coerulea]
MAQQELSMIQLESTTLIEPPLPSSSSSSSSFDHPIDGYGDVDNLSSSSLKLEVEEEDNLIDDDDDDEVLVPNCLLSRNVSSSRLNAGAPEFIPRIPPPNNPTMVMHASFSTSSPPMFHVPYQTTHTHTYGGVGVGVGVAGVGFAQQQQQQHKVPLDVQPQPADHPPEDHPPPSTTRNTHALSEEVRHKILNQVEYYFSDVNLATTDHLIRFISKDPDGFVPISVVASFKKIKALVSNHHQLGTVLRKSSKLVVSEDGKRVRRQHPLTESDMETLQSRIVIAENLPEDHSYQNLMRLFGAVGSVKTIRTCQPQISNTGPAAASRLSKTENMLFSNKLHAFVEYETVEIADKAVTELNDERNWRSGLRVRLLLKRMSKSMQARGRKFGPEGEGNVVEDDASISEQLNDKQLEGHCQSTVMASYEHIVEECNHDKEGGARRSRGRGRGKGRSRGHHHNIRGSHVGTPPTTNSMHNEQSTANKQPLGPRMPDGTRGFVMGRGKPVISDI